MVIEFGSQGMSRLHVCVDRTWEPSGRVMVNGALAIFLFVTGAPSTKKCAVAPESNKAYWTVRWSLVGLKMVLAFGRSLNCCCSTKLHQARVLVGNVMLHEIMGVT